MAGARPGIASNPGWDGGTTAGLDTRTRSAEPPGSDRPRSRRPSPDQPTASPAPPSASARSSSRREPVGADVGWGPTRTSADGAVSAPYRQVATAAPSARPPRSTRAYCQRSTVTEVGSVAARAISAIGSPSTKAATGTPLWNRGRTRPSAHDRARNAAVVAITRIGCARCPNRSIESVARPPGVPLTIASATAIGGNGTRDAAAWTSPVASSAAPAPASAAEPPAPALDVSVPFDTGARVDAVPYGSVSGRSVRERGRRAHEPDHRPGLP